MKKSEFMFKAVNTASPCPICDHTDWCGIMIPKEDTSRVLHLCQRAKGFNKMDVYTSSVDGKQYIMTGISGESRNCIFEDAAEWQARNPQKKPNAEISQQARPSERVEYTAEPMTPQQPTDILDKVYRTFLSLHVLEEKHREYMHKEGFTDEMLTRYHIVSIPENDFYRYNNKAYKTVNVSRKQAGFQMWKRFGDLLEGVPGFYQSADRNGEPFWTYAGCGGILIPLYDVYGKIYGLRIRVDRRWKDDRNEDITKEEYELRKMAAKREGVRPDVHELGKYMNFSSYQEDRMRMEREHVIANRYKRGCQSGSKIGFYWPMESMGRAQNILFVTEGEKKAIVVANHLGKTCISVPGVGEWPLMFQPDEKGSSIIKVLKGSNVKMLIVAYDADLETNEKVMRAQAGLIDALREEGIAVGVAGWNIEQGKGLDDLLNNGGTPTYRLIK